MKLRFSINVPNWLDRIVAFPLLTYRRLRFGYPFRRIRLMEGKFTIVDPADFYRLNSFNWLICGKNDNLYAARLIPMRTGWLKTILMHKEILNAPSGLLVDHRNANSFDNRRANLRRRGGDARCRHGKTKRTARSAAWLRWRPRRKCSRASSPAAPGQSREPHPPWPPPPLNAAAARSGIGKAVSSAGTSSAESVPLISRTTKNSPTARRASLPPFAAASVCEMPVERQPDHQRHDGQLKRAQP